MRGPSQSSFLVLVFSSSFATTRALVLPHAPQPQHLKQQSQQLERRDVLSNILFTAGLLVSSTRPAFADEIGLEKDAPTLYTGETVEICTKRGPLGACLKTEYRTEENDNDKAKKYFRDPAKMLRDKNEVLQGNVEGEANPLIEKLRQKSEDNKEKNRLDVERKTFENDQSATFGPFDRQVVIMNTDGKTFTLLASPQAMRLKKAGFIENRRFVKQPTAEEIEQALESEGGEGLAGALQGLFGGGGGSDN